MSLNIGSILNMNKYNVVKYWQRKNEGTSPPLFLKAFYVS